MIVQFIKIATAYNQRLGRSERIESPIRQGAFPTLEAAREFAAKQWPMFEVEVKPVDVPESNPLADF